MSLTRRELLKLTGISTLGAVLAVACGIPEKELQIQSPVNLPEDLVTGSDNWYATLCRQCPSNEGVLVRIMEGRAKKIEGNPDYPINQGKTFARCQATVQDLYHPDRIRTPLRRSGTRGEAEFTPISWDQGLDELVRHLKTQQDLGNNGRVFFLTQPIRGHVNMLIDRFIKSYGGKHLTLEPIEQTVVKEAVSRVFHEDLLPKFDIENAKYMLSFGADFLETWLSPVQYSRMYGKFRQQPKHRGTFVQIEPRFSMTAANADEWVFVPPGTEGLLALSIAYVLISEGLADAAAADAFTNGQGRNYLEAYNPERIANRIGIHGGQNRIRTLAHSFAQQQPSLAIGGGSAGAHTNGLFNLTAVFSLNLLMNNVNKPGGILFNPNPPLKETPSAPRATSFKEWQEFTDSLNQSEPPQLHTLLVQGANPVHSLTPLKFNKAINENTFIVSFSSFIDETTAFADLVLPHHTSLETWDDDIPDPGPGYQTIGWQQPVVQPMHNTRGFGDVLLTIAQELGFEQSLPWNTSLEVLRERARHLFQTGRGSVKATTFEAFWNGILQRGGWWDINHEKRPTPPRLSPAAKIPVEPVFSGSKEEFPWHLVPFASLSLLDGRGAHLPWLQAMPDPLTTAVWGTWIEINTKTAKEMAILEGDILAVVSPHGEISVPAYPHPGIPPGIVSIPVGQGHRFSTRYAEKRGVNPLDILSPHTEMETGCLAWAATRVNIRKTGDRVRIAKLEGTVPSFELKERPIIQTTDHRD